nr:sodium:solute symporter family protein [uncultured Methanospirillum sp.]
MTTDPVITLVIVLVYVGITLGLGYLGYRRTNHAEDYLLAGRDTHPVIIALSYGATFISTSAIVGFGGVAANLGMGLIWLTVFNIGIGILLAFVVFGKKTREKGVETGAVTFPDLMGKIFQSPGLQFLSGLIILIGMPLYTAAVLIGGARFLESTLNISYTTSLIVFAAVVAVYVMYGGLIAVMYTDAFQGAIMFVGMTLLLVLTYVYLGGVTVANSALAAMSDLVPASLTAQGMTGWASMPELGSPIWFTLITTLVLGVGIGVLAQPQLVVRFMTAKDNRALNRAVLVGGPFILMMTGVAFTVGALTNVYFLQHTGKIAVTAAGGNIDSIIPVYINQAMPEIFVIIFMLTLLSAAMSTLSALYHTMGTALVCDIWGRGKTCALSVRANQIGCLVMMILSVILALSMPEGIIARATAMFMGLCASAFLPAFAVGVYSHRPSRTGAVWSMIIGALTWFFWTAFVHTSEAKTLGISQALTGVQTILGLPWSVIDPLVFALPLSFIVMVLCQLRERRPKDLSFS